MKFLKAMFTGFAMLYWVAAILGFLRYGIDCFKGDLNPGLSFFVVVSSLA
jgi:hypothetical protein